MRLRYRLMLTAVGGSNEVLQHSDSIRELFALPPLDDVRSTGTRNHLAYKQECRVESIRRED